MEVSLNLILHRKSIRDFRPKAFEVLRRDAGKCLQNAGRNGGRFQRFQSIFVYEIDGPKKNLQIPRANLLKHLV